MPSHYLIQWWNNVNLTLGNKLQRTIYRNYYIFIQEDAFENVVWEMSATFSQPQCVKTHPSDAFFIIKSMITQDCTRQFLMSLLMDNLEKMGCIIIISTALSSFICLAVLAQCMLIPPAEHKMCMKLCLAESLYCCLYWYHYLFIS